LAYECVMFNPEHLSPGETAYGIVVAQNEKQARIVRDYTEAKFGILAGRGWKVFEDLPAQSKAVTAEEIRLANRVVVKCMPCKKVAVRGLTTIAIVLDEIGHWQLEEGAYNADVEILRAVRPTRATMKSRGYKVPLLKTSTPYDEIGVFYDDYKRRFQTRQLVMHEVPTRYLNPSVSLEFLEEERIADPESYPREYEAKWHTGAQSKKFTRAMVEACTERGRDLEAPVTGAHYVAHIDAAFKQDFFPLGIGRLDGESVVLSALRIWKPEPERPLSDEDVVAEQVPILRAYGVDAVVGDQFCDIPLKNEYAKHGIGFIERPVNEENKLKEYRNLLSVMTAQKMKLPDMEEIARDLTGLRWKGKKIEAAKRKGAHDDVSAVLRRLAMDLLPMINSVNFADLNRGAVLENAGGSGWFGQGEPPESFEVDIMGTVL